jgi:cytochrome c oxidase subunit 2
MKGYNQIQPWASRLAGIAVLLADLLLAGSLGFGAPTNSSQIPNIFKPQSTYAYSIYRLSVLVLAVCAVVFVVVFGLLGYCVVKYRRRQPDDGREPPQVELACTVIPLLILGFYKRECAPAG